MKSVRNQTDGTIVVTRQPKHPAASVRAGQGLRIPLACCNKFSYVVHLFDKYRLMHNADYASNGGPSGVGHLWGTAPLLINSDGLPGRCSPCVLLVRPPLAAGWLAGAGPGGRLGGGSADRQELRHHAFADV
ncbi:hypothetical protein ACPZ19_16645 [Amycolatopsis lurida]